jgi:hypothetical protein
LKDRSERHPANERAKDAVVSAFERRAARAGALADESSVARAPLEFAVGLFRAQGALAAAVLDAHRTRPLCGDVADDIGAYAGALTDVLDFAMKHGPPLLRDLARERRAEDPRARLSTFWRQGGSGREDYLSRALLRPYAEVLSSRGITPSRPAAAGGCPVCKGFPAIAWRATGAESDGAQSFLGCAQCGHEWPSGRIRCAACGEEDPAKLSAFQSDRHPTVRIETCATCRTYVKSIDLTIDARAVPEVDELLSLSMDVWAADQGYVRLEPGLAGI